LNKKRLVTIFILAVIFMVTVAASPTTQANAKKTGVKLVEMKLSCNPEELLVSIQTKRGSLGKVNIQPTTVYPNYMSSKSIRVRPNKTNYKVKFDRKYPDQWETIQASATAGGVTIQKLIVCPPYDTTICSSSKCGGS